MAAKNDVLTVLTETINAISAIDAHTHLDASHLSARGLHDIMLYHMVVSELYTALRFAAPVRKRINNKRKYRNQDQYH